MFFPLSDDDSRLEHPAYLTITFVLLNIALFAYQLAEPAFTMGWSAVPLEITKGVDLVGTIPLGTDVIDHVAGPSPIYITLLSSMFMHGGWAHLGGNLLYLWIFGDNVEHRFGWKAFLLFYLGSGLAASATQIALAPDSIIPTLGASGAISGVLGAYLVLFPKNQVKAVFLIRIVSIPAFIVLGLWIAMQLFSGYQSLGNIGLTGGVAYGAHIGGFVAGVIAGLIARSFYKGEPPTRMREKYRADPVVRDLWARPRR